MKLNNQQTKPQFKYIECECCQYPIAVPAEASAAVCIPCPQCGHRSCS